MKICAVIVTYADRFHLVKQVADELIAQKCSHIFIVDNHSLHGSATQLENYRLEQNGKVSIISLSTNTGSANGFATGISHAIDSPFDFIWLLDDDNLPQRNALDELETFWTTQCCISESTALLSLRDRGHYSAYEKAVDQNMPSLIPGNKNVFRSFHYKTAAKELFCRKKIYPMEDKKFGIIHAAPYGGFFFHKDLIGKTGLPDTKMVLYYDDYDFTYRVTKNKGSIFLVKSSRIKDIDTTWHESTSGFAFNKIALEKNHLRLYYSLRNRVYFEINNLVDNRFDYFINMTIYSFFVVFKCLTTAHFENMMLYFSALSDGLHSRMGMNKKYSLH